MEHVWGLQWTHVGVVPIQKCFRAFRSNRCPRLLKRIAKITNPQHHLGPIIEIVASTAKYEGKLVVRLELKTQANQIVVTYLIPEVGYHRVWHSNDAGWVRTDMFYDNQIWHEICGLLKLKRARVA